MKKKKAYTIAQKYCEECRGYDDPRDEKFVFPENVEAKRDIAYGPHDVDNMLDVYRPKDKNGKLPVLVSAHGGGYAYGDKERYQFYTSQFCEYGFAVINYNYRKTPNIMFPSPIIETNKVFKWIVENAEEYGFDTDNIVMLGDSAGAQMTSQYATAVTNPTYAKILKLDIPKFTLRAVSLGCGLYDLTESSDDISDIKEIYLTKNPLRFREKAKVLKYITSKFPPAYLMSSPGDFLLSKMEPMYKYLSEKGVEAERKVYGNEETYHVFFCDLNNPYGKEANKDQIEFLLKHINN